MRHRLGLAALAAVIAFSAIAPAAHAAFGVQSFLAEARKSATPGDLDSQAGSHPFVGVTDFTMNNVGGFPDGNVKNIRVDLPPGLISNPEATPKCTDAQFPSCPANTKLGTEEFTAGPLPPQTFDVFNMVPKAGQVSVFAFNSPLGRTDIVGGIRTNDYGLFFTISDVPQNANLVRSVLTFYGVPAQQNGGGGAPIPFITLPTSCGPPQTTTLTVESYNGETATAKSTTPTGATGCDALPFAPKFTVTTSAKVSQASGAGLQVTLQQAEGESNAKSVSVHLPVQFAARFETLQLACPEDTFNKDPKTCADGSKVGTATAATPVLHDPLQGTVYLVAHSGGGLPTLEVILEGPGLRIALSSTITLGAGITSTFPSIPDVPISQFTLNLPQGPHSALTTRADLCAAPMVVESTVFSQSGKTVQQSTPVTVTDCGIAIVSSAVKGSAATLMLRVPAGGTVTVSGKGLKTVKRNVNTQQVKVKLALTKKGKAALKRKRLRHRKLAVTATARFAPAAGTQAAASKATKKLVFK
jgi:hypothetical protein